MQFNLHINDCNNGTEIAKELRRLADTVDGYPLNHGFQRMCQPLAGYCTMTIEPEYYPSMAAAGEKLGLTLEWRVEPSRGRLVGTAYGHPHAYVQLEDEPTEYHEVDGVVTATESAHRNVVFGG